MASETDHGRSKYKRVIHCLESPYSAVVDVYSVLEAFQVTCPARQHLLKKILCTGIRGKGDSLQDLQEAKVALDRAIELEHRRLEKGHTVSQERIDSDPGIDVTTAARDGIGTDRGEWKVYAVRDNDKIAGYRVGWPVKSGGAFLVAHYMAAEENTAGPSLGWCQAAAGSNADRLNQQGKRPEEYRSFQHCGITSEDLV